MDDPPAPVIPIGHTVLAAVIQCGVLDVLPVAGLTQAAHVAGDIFGNQFSTCMDVTFKELDEHFKAYGELTIAQG